MFFIIGFDRRKGGEKEVYDKNGRRYVIYYLANCLSIFFIPILKTSKVFYIEVGGNAREISKEQYLQMAESGRVPEEFENMSNRAGDFQQAYESAYQQDKGTYAGGRCPICGNELDSSYAFCPYCGQKRPRA